MKSASVEFVFVFYVLEFESLMCLQFILLFAGFLYLSAITETTNVGGSDAEVDPNSFLFEYNILYQLQKHKSIRFV